MAERSVTTVGGPWVQVSLRKIREMGARITGAVCAPTLVEKIVWWLSAILLAGLLSAIVVHQTMLVAQASLNRIIERDAPAMLAAHEMEINVVEFGLKVLKYIELGMPEDRSGAHKDIADFGRFHTRYAELAHTPKELALSLRVRQQFTDYQILGLRLIDYADARRVQPGVLSAINDNISRELTRFITLRTALDDLLDEHVQASAVMQFLQTQEAARAAQTQALLWLIVLSMWSAALVLSVAIWLVRAVRGPTQTLVLAAEAFGAGRLEHRLPSLNDPHLNRAADGFNRMAARLEATMVSKVKLTDSEARFRGIVETMEEGYYETDLLGNIQFCNPALETQFGYAPGALIGVNYRQLNDEATSRKFDETFSNVYRTGKFALIEGEGLDPDGNRHDISASVQLMRDAEGNTIGFRGLQYDITERKRAEKLLAHQALHDALTNLPNRYLLKDRIEQAVLVAVRANSACALIILDIDDFKEFNKTLGHMAGDELLRQIARGVLSCIRSTDTLGRLGGDEFAVVLPGADLSEAERLAQQILATFQTPFALEMITTPISVSAGIALYPQHGTSAEVLLRHAEVALYTAKRDRSGYVVYASEHDPHNIERLTLGAELHCALERDELILYYQPKISLRDRTLLGMEALMRWQHPTRGLLLPQEFIPQVQRQNLTRPFTLWAIANVARQWAAWRASGLDIPIAVNLSPRLLRDATFVNEVLALLTGDSASWLELEVTEDALMANPSLSLEHLKPLRARGVRLSIDDFGTGYSSLAYLREFQVDTLKIDISFVRNLSIDENSAMIVRTIIQLAHNLGLGVIAEGVETQEVCNRLLTLGCDAAQGFYFCRPMPAAECLPWVDAWLADSGSRLDA